MNPPRTKVELGIVTLDDSTATALWIKQVLIDMGALLIRHGFKVRIAYDTAEMTVIHPTDDDARTTVVIAGESDGTYNAYFKWSDAAGSGYDVIDEAARWHIVVWRIIRTMTG